MNKKIFAILAVCAMVMTACGPVVEESAQSPETSAKTTTAEAVTTSADAVTTTSDAETTAAVNENSAGGNNNSAETTVQTEEKADSNKMAELSPEPPVYTMTLTSENAKMPALPANYDAFPEISTDLNQFYIPDYLDYEYQAIAYNYTGTTLRSCVLTLYNSHDDEVFSIVYNLDGNNVNWSEPNYTDYEYDANGNPTLISYYEADGLIYEEKFTYDANGNVTYSERNNAGTDEKLGTTNTYDQYGNILVSEGVNALDGEFKDTYTYEYDGNGNAVYGKVDATNPWTFNEFRQRFDDRGNMIEFVGKCDKNAEDFHRELAYDSNNNCIYEKSYYSDDVAIATITEYLYDENNNRLCQMINSSGYTYTDYYEYDAKGRKTKYYNQSSDSEDIFTIYVYEELS